MVATSGSAIILLFLLLLSGKDATTAFEDIGHSEEAIALRDGTYLIGTVKRMPPTTVQPPTRTSACT